VNDPELIFSNYYNQLSEILKASGIKQQPVVREQLTLDLVKGTEWVRRKTIAYPDLAYNKDADFKAGEDVRKACEEFHEEMQERDTSAIDSLLQAFPFTIVGH